MADETEERVYCPVCGKEPDVTTEDAGSVEEGNFIPAGTLRSGWYCQDQVHWACEEHRPVTLADVDQHRLADALDSLDGRLAAEEDE